MTSNNDFQLSYRSAGVDIDAGEKLVESIKPAAQSTSRPGAKVDLGGFGGVFDLKAAGFSDPVLVSGADGVGTKLKLAFDLGKHRSVGIDLVAMCANDVLAQGAEPLYFLDYFATSRLEESVAKDVIVGIAEGCRRANCALIGGETAEMPGMYKDGHYDLAGFVVGAAERGKLLPQKDEMKPGDLLIAIGSSGPHSNGFSLIHKVIQRSEVQLNESAPYDPDRSLGEALLKPTKIYTSSLLPLIKSGKVKGLAHITGGGLIENPKRMLPANLQDRIDWTRLPPAPVFEWIKSVGRLDDQEMRRTFNMGVGMICAIAEEQVEAALAELSASGEEAWVIGEIISA